MANGASEMPCIESKAKIFICYARFDLAFTDRLVAGLHARGFEVLIDRSDIFPAERWLERIKELIAQSDTVVFVISPESISSKVCKYEVAFAVSLNKPIVPIVWRPVRARDVLKELSVSDLFDRAINAMVRAGATVDAWRGALGRV